MVENDAGIELSRPAMAALTRGLSFVPNEQPTSSSLHEDLERLRRNINLRLHWNVHRSDGHRNSLVSKVLRSTWSPPEALLSTNELWRQVLATANGTSPSRPNLDRETLRAWQQLTRNDSIYVLKADKGGKTVILRKTDYITEATRQLNDRSTYSELSKDQAEAIYDKLRQTKAEIVAVLLRNGNITKAESERLLQEQVRIPAIYFLPKIHKEKRADTGTFPARPITAAVGSMFKSLDEYLAHIVAVLLPSIPGNLVDTGALLRDLRSLGTLPASTCLFSADVESLYPSIPWAEGLSSATWFYASRFHVLKAWADDNNYLAPPNPLVFRRILAEVLQNNVFHFQDSRYFRQLKGTAMGCSMSVFLANTFMYKRTRHLLESPPNDLRYIGRYIDDIVGVWTGQPHEIEQLFAQTVDEHIRLTFVIGGRSLEALDLVLELENDGSIATRLYRKPTDGSQFLHWDSAHPTSLKTSVPYAQLLRIKRNCSRPADYRLEADRLLKRFRDRGYPDHVLISAQRKADATERLTLLQTGVTQRRQAGDSLTLVTAYNSELDRPLKHSVRHFYARLLESPLVRERADINGQPLPLTTPRVAYRAGRSLGSALGPIFKRGPRQADGRPPPFTQQALTTAATSL